MGDIAPWYGCKGDEATEKRHYGGTTAQHNHHGVKLPSTMIIEASSPVAALVP